MWWDSLTKEGPDFDYYPNTWLVTKEGCHTAGTGVNVTPDGRPYLGAAVGSAEYVENYVKSRVDSWLSIVRNLTTIAKTQPHAAYSALTWSFKQVDLPMPYSSNLLKPLDDNLRTIPTLTGRPPPSDLECALFALPARMGGLGITVPSMQADQEHQSSLLVTSALILLQDEAYGYEAIAEQLDSKAIVSNKNKENHSLDVRVFNLHAPSNRHANLQSVYRKHEQIKKRAYEQRIRELPSRP